MRWVAIFEDNEGLDSIRKAHASAHFEYLSANRDKIVIAGGLRPAPGEWYSGGLWVLEVDSKKRRSDWSRAIPTSSWGFARAIAYSCGARLPAMRR